MEAGGRVVHHVEHGTFRNRFIDRSKDWKKLYFSTLLSGIFDAS